MHIRHIPLLMLLFILAAISLVPFVQANARLQTNLQFVPVTPCRVADTRLPDGPFGGPAIPGKTSRDFAIPNSACNIPDSAAAYSLNITVVPQGSLDYLTAWPAGQTQPLVSTLNSPNGQTKANAAIIPAGSNAAISIYVTDTTNVVLDINGYFVSASSSTLAFFPLTPCRVADTRGPDGPLGGPSLNGGQQWDFPLLASSCAIPYVAQAYSLNFTVVPKGPLGYLTVWPAGQPQPLVSTLNAPTGATTANAAITVGGFSGAISVYPTGDTDLVIDIDGYFAPTDSGPGPLSLYTLAPCRLLDTRNAAGAFTGTIAVDVTGSPCRVPDAQAYVLNATVVPEGPLDYLTLWPNQEGQPYVSTVNAWDGATNANMAMVATLNGSINAFASNPTNLVLDIFSYFAAITPLSLITSSLPAGTMDTSYSASLRATGGITPYSWSIASGSLPAGLNLNSSTGAITGTPTGAGTWLFTVQVADSEEPPATATAQLSITIAPAVPLSITTTSLPDDTVNTPYDATVTAIGGVAPYAWSIASGSLPAGLTINSSTGEITGTPTVAATSNFTVEVTDSEVPPVGAQAQLSITIRQGGGGDPGKLNGNYAFFLKGADSTGRWTMAGSFISDGKGNITSGILDGNSIAGQPYTTTVTGHYSITPLGLNSMTIHGPAWGPMTLAFVLSSSGNGRIIEYDDENGQGGRGSGMLRKQDPSAFSSSQISGGYAFGMTGAGQFGTTGAGQYGARASQVGIFAIDQGNIPLGLCAINEGGAYSLCSFTGTMSAVNPQTGRATTQIQSTRGNSNQAVYVVTTSEMLLEQTDWVAQTGNPLLLGWALRQVGPFSNASLNGPAVLYSQDVHTADGADESGAMIVNFDGSGNFTVVAYADDLGGTITQNGPTQGTYTVETDGTFTLTFDEHRNDGGPNTTTGYLVSPNQGMLVHTGPNSLFGILEAQTGGPFSNASLQGTYSAGSLEPLDYTNAVNSVTQGSADGQGAMTAGADSSGTIGLTQENGNITYDVLQPSGTGTISDINGNDNRGVFFMISPGKFVVLHPDSGARMEVFEH